MRTIPRTILLAVAATVAVVTTTTSVATGVDAPRLPAAQAAQAAEAAAGATAGASAGALDRTAKPLPTFTVRGAVARPRFFDLRQLERHFTQHEVTATFESGSGSQSHEFSGPLLYDVALSVRPRFDPAVKNDALAFAVVVTATDRYRALVSWGEFDPAFGARQILLATQEDGERLDRPRLVVPGDVKGGRYVSDIRTVVIRDLGR